MAVNSSVEKQPVDQQASGEVQAEIDTRSDGVITPDFLRTFGFRV